MNQSPFEVLGFRLFGRVMFNNQYYFVYGRRISGFFNIRDINGKNSIDISYKKLKLFRNKRYMIKNETV